MGKYILRRLVLLVPVLLGLTLLTFGLTNIVPGDPALLAAGPGATREMYESVRQEFGLDDPVPVQYANYMIGLAQGDWGRSILTRRPVSYDLRIFWPATIELVLVAMIFSIVVGVPLGVVSAVGHDRWPDHASRIVALVGVSLPAFWLAILLQWTVGLNIGAIPIGGRIAGSLGSPEAITRLYLVDSLIALDFDRFKSALAHLILPAFTLSMAPLATVTRMTRSSMLDVLGQDYIRSARAKGLAERTVLMRHALRNAFIPTLTMIGLSLGWLMGGTVLVEAIFDWPGVGLYAVNAALTLDFMPIMGITIVYGVAFSLINLLVDVLYAYIDPRIRFE